MRARILVAVIALLPSVALAGGVTNPPGLTSAAAQALINQMAVAKAGGDASATNVTAPGGFARTQAARSGDIINVRDFHAVADATETPLASAAASGVLSLVLTGTPAVAAGMAVSVPQGQTNPFASGTTVSAVSVSGGNTTITLSSATTSALAAAALVDVGTDNTTFAQNAQNYAQGLGREAQIEWPSGAYLLTGTVYSVSAVSWRLNGAYFVGQGRPSGLQIDPLGSAISTWRSSSIQRNEWGINLTGQILARSSLANIGSYEKGGFVVRLEQDDPATGDGTNWYAAGHDVTGGEIEINAGGGNQFARLFGIHSQLSWPSGTDGQGHLIEAEISSAGTYTPQESSQLLKNVIHVTNLGTNDVTSGIEIDGGSGSGKFHVAYETFAQAIRSDGYAFAMWPISSGDLTTVPLFGVDPTGTVYAQNINMASVNPSFVGSKPTFQAGLVTTSIGVFGGATISNGNSGGTGLTVTQGISTDTLSLTGSQPASSVLIAPTGSAGPPAWRPPAVADVTGAAPLASPAFTGTPTVPTATAGASTTQAASTAFVGGAISTATSTLAPKASPTFTGYAAFSVGAGLSAAGTTLATATALTKQDNFVTTVASGSGVALPNAPVGAHITVGNRGANTLNIYPFSSSDQIEATTAGTAATLAANTTAVFERDIALHWYRVQ